MAWATEGRSTTAGFTMGAATMKMTSSTSITSMYGTTLMSALARRREPPRRWMAAMAGAPNAMNEVG
ncbi:hypothetical protein D3C81_2265700 [compost metagenome]